MDRQRSLGSLLIAVALLGGCGSSPTGPTGFPVRGGGRSSAARLTLTRYLAFGDSLTAGIIALPTGNHRLSAGLPQSFPAQLLAGLSRRYDGQAIDIQNAGRPGEFAEDGVRRLRGVLAESSPDVVILMHGVNDVTTLGGTAVRPTAAFLDTMILDTRRAGAEVILATLPPQRPGALRAAAPGVIASYNRAIREVAVARRALLVDFEAELTDLRLIGPDGLHPTSEGYTRMAEVVLRLIAREFERIDLHVVAAAAPETSLLPRAALGDAFVRPAGDGR